MSLLNSFPEIEFFFQKIKFTNSELDLLRQEINLKYSINEIRKSGLNLIDLKLVQYELKKEESKFKAITKNPNFRQSINFSVFSEINRIKSLNIENISIELDWSFKRFQTLLAQKEIVKINTETLNDAEFILVKDMISNRINILKRLKKQTQFKKAKFKNLQIEMKK
jgi:hypothetical protein